MQNRLRKLSVGLLCLLLLLGATGVALAGTLTLPAATREIEDEAFYGAASVTDVSLPYGVARIGERAFVGSGLKRINLPESLTYIAPNAFEGLRLERVQVTAGSYAEAYCKARGIACDARAILESAHPYATHTEQTWTWTGDADTVWLEVTFSRQTEVELWSDILLVMDTRGNRVGSYTGTELSGATLGIAGNGFSVRLSSLGSTAHYGFSVVQVVQHKAAGLQLLAQRDVSPAVDQPMAVNLRAYGVANPAYAVRVTRDGVTLDARTTREATYAYTPTQTGRYTIHAQLLNGSGAVVSETSMETDVTERAFAYAATPGADHCAIRCCAEAKLGALRLPDVIYGRTVTAIDSYAFFYDSQSFLGDLKLPSGLTTIGQWAFSGCSGLTGNLTLPSGLTTIGERAFFGCSGLTGNLALPSGLTTIGERAFFGCSGLTGGLALPSGLTTIESSVFRGCSGLTGNLTLPTGLTAIGTGAFYDCSGLTGKLALPAGLTAIGAEAFRNCSGLTGNLALPAGLTTLGDAAFCDCSGFTGTLTLPAKLTAIGQSAFCGCSGLKGKLTLPAGLTAVGDFAFAYCDGFSESLALPTGLTTIGERAFFACSSLTGDLVLPARLITLGEYAFDRCSGFTSIHVRSSATALGTKALPSAYNRKIPIYGQAGSTAQTYAKQNSAYHTFTVE